MGCKWTEWALGGGITGRESERVGAVMIDLGGKVLGEGRVFAAEREREKGGGMVRERGLRKSQNQ